MVSVVTAVDLDHCTVNLQLYCDPCPCLCLSGHVHASQLLRCESSCVEELLQLFAWTVQAPSSSWTSSSFFLTFSLIAKCCLSLRFLFLRTVQPCVREPGSLSLAFMSTTLEKSGAPPTSSPRCSGRLHLLHQLYPHPLHQHVAILQEFARPHLIWHVETHFLNLPSWDMQLWAPHLVEAPRWCSPWRSIELSSSEDVLGSILETWKTASWPNLSRPTKVVETFLSPTSDTASPQTALSLTWLAATFPPTTKVHGANMFITSSILHDGCLAVFFRGCNIGLGCHDGSHGPLFPSSRRRNLRFLHSQFLGWSWWAGRDWWNGCWKTTLCRLCNSSIIGSRLQLMLHSDLI